MFNDKLITDTRWAIYVSMNDQELISMGPISGGVTSVRTSLLHVQPGDKIYIHVLHYYQGDYVKTPLYTINVNFHTYSYIGNKATNKADGSIKNTCTICGEVKETTVIPRIQDVLLAETSFVYDGKSKTPAVTVKDRTGEVIVPEHYKVSYVNNKNAGTATAKVTFIGEQYSGTISKTFKITPAANSISATSAYVKEAKKTVQLVKLGAKDKGKKLTYKSSDSKVKVSTAGVVTIPANYSGKVTITVTSANSNYKKVSKKLVITVNPAATSLKSVSNVSGRKMKVLINKSANVKGYQLQYSTGAAFTSNTKTLTIAGNASVSKEISKLTKGKTYYVRVRTYTQSGSSKLYSKWSAKKRFFRKF